MQTTKLTNAKLRTQLELGVANDKPRTGAIRLSPQARQMIAARFMEQSAMLKTKADQLMGDMTSPCWIFQDNSVAFIAADGTRQEILDECYSEISHISIPGMHYIRYKSVTGDANDDDDVDDKDWSSLNIPLFASSPPSKGLSETDELVRSLPIIRISNGGSEGLLSVHIPSGTVEMTNPETGVSKKLDLSNHPVIRKENKQYRIVHTCHPEMLMYYCPVRKLVCDVGEGTW